VIPTLTDEQLEVSAKLTMKMVDLGHSVGFIKDQISIGPIVSVYRFAPKGSTKVSHLEAMAEDFAIALGVENVLVKRIPGESYVSIWVPNKERRYINWRDTISEFSKVSSKTHIPLNFGVDYLGRPHIQDLSSLPHILIAGSTGSGKSTLLSSFIASIIYSKPSNEVQFVLSDTKGVEFGHFEGAPHLLFPVATTVYQTLERLDWLIEEMNRRLLVFGKRGVRNIHEYNQTNADRLSHITLIIDELADLLGDSGRASSEGGPSLGKISSQKIGELARKARASGIHIIAATQRPSTKVVTGDIKANFPARLCFRVPSGIDSRVVLGTEGAEYLLSRGDMLYVDPARPGLHRLHAPIADIRDIQGAVTVATMRERQ
jgi:DNA segregation ATPase FtsK/SpoIIIE, S-DNA-T family